MAVTPASAATANPCPDGTNPYFSSPNVYLSEKNLGGPEQTGIWSDVVTVKSFCWSGRAGDATTPLAGVAVTGVSVVSSGAVPGLVARVDDAQGWQTVPLQGTSMGVTLPTPQGVITDSQGQATFTFEATTLNKDGSVNTNTYLALPNGGTNWVGMDLELGTGMGFADNGPSGPEPLGAGLVFAQTPELDSMALFGSGFMGLASYALMRVRARRRD
jgi:hypothetical protein